MEAEADYLLISGIQHFSFCRRQWALIHLEQQWKDNERTAEGELQHERCHDESVSETRGGIYTVRGMRVVSHRLKLTGVCDVVEFRPSPEGVPVNGKTGKLLPIPIEYKHGSSKEEDCDRLQLCAQAIALEEMFVCSIPRAALFYQETHRREIVELTPELRLKTEAAAAEMNEYMRRGKTPKVRPGKQCNACSLKEICLPKLCKGSDAVKYIQKHITEKEDSPCDAF